MVSGVGSTSYRSSVGRLLDAAASAVAAGRRGDDLPIDAGAESTAMHNRDRSPDRGSSGPDQEAPEAPAAVGEPQDRQYGPAPEARPFSVAFDPTKGVAGSRFEEIVSRRARQAYEAGGRVVDGGHDAAGHVIDSPV